MANGYRVIGRSVPKPDAYVKVTGRAQYAADLWRPNMLFGKAVRSPYAHALIKEIDIRPALALAGIKAVLTAADIPGQNRVGMTGAKEQPVLAEDRVRFCGEAVAVVAATSPEVAAEACRRVRVIYEEIPPVTSPAAALALGAPLLSEQGNTCVRFKVIKGNPDEALTQCEIVIEGEYVTPPVEHAYLEPEAVLAEPCGDGLLVWSTTKSVHHDRGEIARVLSWPLENVHVIAPSVGGSFGGKPDLPLNCMAALLAAKTGLPVKMVYGREESFQVSTKRHACTLKYLHGAKRDGTLVYVRLDALADVGAYKDYSSTVLQRMVIHAAGPYRVPHVHLEVRGILTNNPVAGAMRGFGVPQVVFACERQMDRLAEALGMDPLELRLRNALAEGDSTATGQVLPKASMRALLLKTRDLLAEEQKAPSDKPLKPFEREGWGIGCFFYGNGRTSLSNPGIATVKISKDGLIEVGVGSPDIGQGSDTIFAQIAAEAMGIDSQHIIVKSADTRCTLDSGTTSGTRLTAIVGRAVEIASKKLRNTIIEYAARAYGVEATRIDLVSDADGLKLRATPDLFIPLRDFCTGLGRAWEEVARYDPPTGPLNEYGQGNPYASYTFGVQCARVRVNLLTGRVDVKKVIVAYDVGTVVNPCLLRGQIEGGIAMGLGYALSEKVELGAGWVENPNFDRYVIPTSMDVPPALQVFTLPLPDKEGPFGAKGIGEPAAIPTAAAVANAVSKATGVPFFRLPLSLEEIVARVEEREGP